MLKVEIRNGLPEDKLRKAYLDGLPYAQEFFIENMISKGVVCDLYVDSKQAGYALIADESVLEYYLLEDERSYANEGLAKIVNQFEIKRTVCKSFDAVFLNACHSLNWTMEPISLLFRETSSDVSSASLKIRHKQANENNLAEVLALHDGFFEGEEEIRTYLEDDSRLFIYYYGDTALGCGIIKRIIPWRNDYDIGMVVAPTLRRKGYATEIVRHLKMYCSNQAWTPVAGCSIDNTSSARTLERAGFFSNHKLVEFKRP